MENIDLFIQQYIASTRSSGMTEFMYALSAVFDASIWFILLVAGVSILIYFTHTAKSVLLFVGSLFMCLVSVYVLKILFNVDRPSDPILHAFGKSFPSYHAAIATTFFGSLMYIFKKNLGVAGRALFYAFSVLVVLLVATSRVYLGVHWASDVLAGILVGIFVVHASVRAWKKWL